MNPIIQWSPPEPGARGDALGCFHCGEALGDAAFPIVFEGNEHDTCCRGCQAVAQTIIENGLGSYYRHRSAMPNSLRDLDDPLRQLHLYDLPDIQRTFVSDPDGSGREKEASLLLDGMTCAACVWLVEQRLARIPGVHTAAVNYATRRARVKWDDRRVRLSDILGAVADLGYGAQPYDAARSNDVRCSERRSMMWRLFVAAFGMMQVAMYALPAYVAAGDLAPDLDQLMRTASLALTIPVVAWAAIPFYQGAWRELRARRVGMDVPVVIGILVAFAESVSATLRGTGSVYFDSIAMFVLLLLATRYLQITARMKAVEAQEQLVRLVPAVAERLEHSPAGAHAREVPVAQLKVGDRILVRPGGSVPADGVVTEGASRVDESMLTGESHEIPKRAGDRLAGGTINLVSPLTMRVDHIGQETVFAGIVRLMDRAQAEKPEIATMADLVARWFVTVLLIVCALVLLVWWEVDPSRAIPVVVACLIVTCPCAISLATPAALAAATGTLYRRGIIATRGHAVEGLAKATHFVFDKTGTLTEGKMRLIHLVPLARASPGECLALANRLEQTSEHPIARAILCAARDHERCEAGAIRERRNFPGQGVEGTVGGRLLRLGTPEFVSGLYRRAPQQELPVVDVALTLAVLGDEDGPLALFTFGDPVRDGAGHAVRMLQALGKTVCILSGDRSALVARLGRDMDVDVSRGDLSPGEKLQFVRDLQRRGAIVAMVGDGINDAAALAQAQVSVAPASGTALAQNSADVIMMSHRIDSLVDAVVTARRTFRIIRQNLAWAVVYNACALPLAILGHVTPLIAAAGMSVSSLVVVFNALRLLQARNGTATSSRMLSLLDPA